MGTSVTDAPAGAPGGWPVQLGGQAHLVVREGFSGRAGSPVKGRGLWGMRGGACSSSEREEHRWAAGEWQAQLPEHQAPDKRRSGWSSACKGKNVYFLFSEQSLFQPGLKCNKNCEVFCSCLGITTCRHCSRGCSWEPGNRRQKERLRGQPQTHQDSQPDPCWPQGLRPDSDYIGIHGFVHQTFRKHLLSLRGARPRGHAHRHHPQSHPRTATNGDHAAKRRNNPFLQDCTGLEGNVTQEASWEQAGPSCSREAGQALR